MKTIILLLALAVTAGAFAVVKNDPVPPKYADLAALAVAFEKGELDAKFYFVQVDPDGLGCRLRYRNPNLKDNDVDAENAKCRSLFVYVPPDPDLAGQLADLGIPSRKSALPDERKPVPNKP